MTSLKEIRGIRVTVSGARGPLGFEIDGIPTPGEFLVKAPGNSRKYLTASGTGNDPALRTDLAAGPGGQLVKFTGAGPGAVARDAQSKAREIISGLDYGAIGDGIHDDAPAIQAALDYAGRSGGAAIVHLPQPSVGYRLASGLRIPSNVTLDGGASVRYPFGASNPYTPRLIADFADPHQWVIEAATTSGGDPIPYNVMVDGALPDGTTYNCAVRNLSVTSTGTMPFGGIRMHGCPGAMVDNVSIDKVGCGLLVNFTFGGRFSVHCETPYYGIAVWDDANANTFEGYVARTGAASSTVPADYRLSFMSALSTTLTTTFKLSTNAHSSRPFGLLVGSTSSTSVNNVFDVVVERYSGGIFSIFGSASVFRKCYIEGGANDVEFAIVASQASFRFDSLHAYMSGTGALVDLGLSILGKIFPSGSIFPASWGTGPYLDTSSALVIEGLSPAVIGPPSPQFNIVYPDAVGAWVTPSLVNSWASIAGRFEPAYHLNRNSVELRGAVTGGASGTVAFTLPAGFRPIARCVFGNAQIDPGGDVTINAAGPVSLDGIYFEAGQ